MANITDIARTSSNAERLNRLTELTLKPIESRPIEGKISRGQSAGTRACETLRLARRKRCRQAYDNKREIPQKIRRRQQSVPFVRSQFLHDTGLAWLRFGLEGLYVSS